MEVIRRTATAAYSTAAKLLEAAGSTMEATVDSTGATSIENVGIQVWWMTGTILLDKQLGHVDVLV
ncbi:MAG: hypothetical protein LBC65_03125 [Oscillospiraceae bacterium]|jgi:hypothetical protein|nr:hypothetical protein [Oscillospiraceae bacterium]